MIGTLHKRQVERVETEGQKLVGLVAPYDRETNIGGGRERIARGAFERTLSSDDEVLCLADHDASKLLGRRSVGTLRLTDTDEGLGFEVELPDTQLGRDVRALAKRGDLGGMSFGFLIPKGGERRDGNVRVLTEIDLREVSVVSAWPAYDGTRVEARRWHLGNSRNTGRTPHFLRWR